MNFPVLRLMKDDFIKYFNEDLFSRLVFQYQVAIQDTTSYVYLVFYAIDSENYPINTCPVNLIYNPSDPIVTIAPPFYLGNIELSKDEITGAVNDPDFSYFSFKAVKDKKDGYIGFDINANKELTVPIKNPKNPCPPDCPRHLKQPPSDQPLLK